MQAALLAPSGTLLFTTYVRCGPSSFVSLFRVGIDAGLRDQPERLAPLEAGAEPLEEDGDDADGKSRAIQACLHLVTSLSFLPRLGDLTEGSSAGEDLNLSNSTFVGVRSCEPPADAWCACFSASSSSRWC